MPKSHVFFRDYETRSAADLKKVGAHSYAMNGHTEVTVAAYAVDDGPVKTWHPDDDSSKIPPEFIKAATEPGWLCVAHNVNFERLIEQYVLGPQFKFPPIPIEKQRCTMAMSLACALPAKLESVAVALNLINQKDKEGNRLMLRTSKPRRPRKDEDPNEIYYDDDEIKMEQVSEYCEQDVETTRELWERLPKLTPDEQRTWILDAKINDCGFYMDRKLVQSAIKIAQTAYPMLDKEMTDVTHGAVTSFNKVAKLTAWLNDRLNNTTHKDAAIKSLSKEAVEYWLTQKIEPDVRRAFELRLLGAQASVKKLNAIWARRELDGRVRGAFMYHYAGTGRWSSHGVQVHNLKRLSLTPEELATALKLMETGDYQKMRKVYSNPLSVIGGCIRAVICAPEEKLLQGADFSGIEARVTAWIAKEKKKLDIFRDFDAGRGPDPYIVAAAKIFNVPPDKIDKPKRQTGKAAELAFGFQGGVAAYRRFSPSGSTAMTMSQKEWNKAHGGGRGGGYERDPLDTGDFTDDEIQKIKYKWRAAHPNIERYWHDVNRAAWAVIKDHSITVRVNNVTFECDDAPFMWITLPSGRKLSYPHARVEKVYEFGGKLVPHPNGQPSILFKDNSMGRWRDVRIYGGLLTENIVQAISRDLLRDAMLRIDAAGFKIVTHVHDECVVEVPASNKREKEFGKLMVATPAWADADLPLVAKVWSSPRYVK